MGQHPPVRLVNWPQAILTKVYFTGVDLPECIYINDIRGKSMAELKLFVKLTAVQLKVPIHVCH